MSSDTSLRYRLTQICPGFPPGTCRPTSRRRPLRHESKPHRNRLLEAEGRPSHLGPPGSQPKGAGRTVSQNGDGVQFGLELIDPDAKAWIRSPGIKPQHFHPAAVL